MSTPSASPNHAAPAEAGPKHAVVIGAGGGLGGALIEALSRRQDVDRLFALSRRFDPPAADNVTCLVADAADPRSMARVATTISEAVERIHLLIICTGVLHAAGVLHDPGRQPPVKPEKCLADLDAASFQHVMTVNALAPLQALAVFAPLLRHADGAVAAVLSATVGSIGDNRLGGWYSYRMSKAALNMGVKNAAIELARGASPSRQAPIVVAVHPGTTVTALSEPWVGRRRARSPAESARHVLSVLDGLEAGQSGGFFNWDGTPLPW